MQESNSGAWDWRGQAPVPLPDEISKISIEELINAHRSLETRLQRMALMVDAMRELLQEANLLNEAELKAKFDEIDLRDGTLDGQAAKPFLQVCKSCGTKSYGLRRFCQNCGSESLLAAN